MRLLHLQELDVWRLCCSSRGHTGTRDGGDLLFAGAHHQWTAHLRHDCLDSSRSYVLCSSCASLAARAVWHVAMQGRFPRLGPRKACSQD